MSQVCIIQHSSGWTISGPVIAVAKAAKHRLQKHQNRVASEATYINLQRGLLWQDY
jgi:hypothetical protein